MADQAAFGTQAGLSVDDDQNEKTAMPERQTELQSPPAAINHASQNLSALRAPLPPASQLATTAIPAAPVTGIVPARAATSAPARSNDPDTPAKASTVFDVVTNAIQPLSPATPEIQALSPTPSPTTTVAAAGAPISTRPAPTTTSPSPTTQVAQAIVEPVKVVLTSPAQTGPATPHVTTIQITPVELGRVEVRIERTNDGPAKIQLIAERPETLSRLVHDQSQLQQALDQAGLPSTSRTLEFSLAPSTTNANASSSSLTGNNTSGGDSSSYGSQRHNNPYSNQNLHETDDNTLGSMTQSRFVRTGIDITA